MDRRPRPQRHRLPGHTENCFLALPLPAALACWAAATRLGLLLARRAKPVLWEESGGAGREAEPERMQDQAPPSPPTRVPPLLDLVQVPGGTFRMGSPPASEKQVADFARRWRD